MTGKRPTRSQLRSRRRLLNSYLLSTENSYKDTAHRLGVREDTLKNFLGKDIKSVRTSYNSSSGYRKIYEAATRKNLKAEAKSQGKRYVELPVMKRAYIPPEVVMRRRSAYNAPKEQQRALFEQARQMQEYSRNVERDYGARISRREQAAMKFQQISFQKGRPRGLYEFLDTNPSEDEIVEYMDDVSEAYDLTAQQQEAFSGRIAAYLGG